MPSPRRPCPECTGTPSWHHVAVIEQNRDACTGSAASRLYAARRRSSLTRQATPRSTRRPEPQSLIDLVAVRLLLPRPSPSRQPKAIPSTAERTATKPGTVSGVLYRRLGHRGQRSGRQHARRLPVCSDAPVARRVPPACRSSRNSAPPASFSPTAKTNPDPACMRIHPAIWTWTVDTPRPRIRRSRAMQSNNPKALRLAGERTLPGIDSENYWLPSTLIAVL